MLAARRPLTQLVCLLLACVVMVSSCQPSPPTATPRPTLAPTVRPTLAPTKAPTLAPSAVPTTATVADDLPPEPGTVVTLSTGGSIFVPEGALPAGATIQAAVTQMPVLPEDVSPVGEALAVSASAGLLRPVTLRLPIPAGVTDPAQLAIVHLAADGALWFLMTRVEGKELVAEAPTFSTFARVRVPSGLPVELRGKDRLLTGEQHTYLVFRSDPETRVSTSWVALGDGTLVQQTEHAATLRAGEQAGHVDLVCACSEQPGGRRWWGSKRIRIVDTGQDPNRFAVSVVANPHVANIGKDRVRVVAAVHGSYQAPLTWTWESDNGVRGGPVTTDAGTSQFELPLDSLGPQDQPGTRTVAVWAKDFQGRMFAGLGSYVLQVEPLAVAVKGRTYVFWNDAPGPVETYTASASGGQPSYAYTFQLIPGADSPRGGSGPDLNTGTFRFEQPGEYRLEVSAVDSSGRAVTTSLAIVAAGGEPLSTRIVTLPATALVNEKVTAVISIRGGVLLTGAGKQGYLLKVDWGDGSAPVVERNVGATTMPYSGTVASMSHSYAQARTYTVRVEARDAAGAMDWFEQDIVITDQAPEPTAGETAQGRRLVWVRQAPQINPNNGSLRVDYGGDPRRQQSFTEYEPGESSHTSRTTYQEDDYYWYKNVVFTVSFDPPPAVLEPGVPYTLTATFSHSNGELTYGFEGLGERFWYWAESFYPGVVTPYETLNYYPWFDPQKVTSTKQWAILAYQPRTEDDSLVIWAAFHGWPDCSVIWEYKAALR